MKRIVVFGQGRVGYNISRYFDALGHNVTSFTRQAWEADKNFAYAAIGQASVVALAVPDDLIAGLKLALNPQLVAQTVIHFSGAQTYRGILSYHPLYSFPQKPLAPEAMASIAIARDENAPTFATLIPGAENPELVIPSTDRAFYHALAVVSGNFSAHLWNKCAIRFEEAFNEPAGPIFKSYFQSLIDRFEESPRDSLTGPLARRDRESVAANLTALEDHPDLTALYKAFLSSAWEAYDRE